MATAMGDLVIRLGAQTAGFDRAMQRSRGMINGFVGAAAGIARMLVLLSGAAMFAGAIRSGEAVEQAVAQRDGSPPVDI